MSKTALAIALFILPLSTGASAAVCGTAPNDTVCLGTVDVPAEQRPAFEAAGKAVVDALSSPDLERDLKAFTSTHIIAGGYAAAWKDVDSDTLLKNVKAAVSGITITTYGGVSGWFKKTFAKDRLEEDAKTGAIRFNRWALPQPSPMLAKTITHTAALKAGLTQPNAGKNPDVAACEPPGVVASLVEKQIVGEKWKRGPDDCGVL